MISKKGSTQGASSSKLTPRPNRTIAKPKGGQKTVGKVRKQGGKAPISAATEFDPTLDPITARLGDPVAIARYRNHFKDAKANAERGIDITNCPKEVKKMVEKRKWDKLVAHPKELPNFSIVREFYSLLFAAGEETDTVNIREQALTISAKAINKHHGLDNIPLELDYLAEIEKIEDFPETARQLICPNHRWNYSTLDGKTPKDITVSTWDDEPRVWFRFITCRLHPTAQCVLIKLPHLKILYAILTGMKIDVGCLIYNELRSYAKGHKGNLQFPTLITDMARSAQVPFSDFDQLPRRNLPMIDKDTLRPKDQPEGFIVKQPKRTIVEELARRDNYTTHECLLANQEQLRVSLVAIWRVLMALMQVVTLTFDVSQYPSPPSETFKFPPYQNPFPQGQSVFVHAGGEETLEQKAPGVMANGQEAPASEDGVAHHVLQPKGKAPNSATPGDDASLEPEEVITPATEIATEDGTGIDTQATVNDPLDVAALKTLTTGERILGG